MNTDSDDEREDLEETDLDDSGRTISRNEAARLIGTSPRTITRWVKDKLLKKQADNKFLLEDIMRLKEQESRAAPTPEDDEYPDHYSEIIEALKLGNLHVEKLFGLVERPLNLTLKGLLDMNQQLSNRVKEADAQYLETMKAAGELLMQKAEREAYSQKEAVKAAMMAQATENIMPLLPILLAQLMGGKKADAASSFLSSIVGTPKAQTVEVSQEAEVPSSEEQETQKSAAEAFIASLDEGEKKRLVAAGMMFQGEKKELFDKMLSELGVK